MLHIKRRKKHKIHNAGCKEKLSYKIFIKIVYSKKSLRKERFFCAFRSAGGMPGTDEHGKSKIG